MRKVSPKTQFGIPVGPILVATSNSKIAPKQVLELLEIGPRLMSWGLMGQDLPPKEKLMATVVLQAKKTNIKKRSE